jgi:condensin complex subunit 1
LLATKKGAKGLIALYAPFVVQLCSHQAVTQGPELLRGAALAALTRFMVLDVKFCEDHLKLVFTRLKHESDKGTRAALLVALGDLAFRFPNAVEPWTEHLYGIKEWGNSLHDSDSSVRQHAITVLSHLVLNDMMKVKGHISEMARCLEDPDPRVAGVAKLFFNELSHKHGNPIYNLLTDLLSRLSTDEDISPEAFKRIMTRLVGFIDKDRQAESICEKMCARFSEAVLAETSKPARDIAFCISQLNLSERAFKKFTESWKMYEGALYDHEVHACFVSMCVKAKRAAKPEVRAFVEVFETKLNETHVEKAAAYNVSARAEGKETVAITEIAKDEEEAANTETEQGDEGEVNSEGEEKPEEMHDADDEPLVRSESKTVVMNEDQENISPDEQMLKVLTPPTSPPRRSRRAAA